jgi:glutathione S-transferase
MPEFKLVIGNKNYSSWSLRPWLALRAAGLNFAETIIPLDHDDTKFGADGDFLFGAFSIADAMFAPVVSRLHVYDIDMDASCDAYRDSVLNHPAMREWLSAAASEDWVIGRLEL